MDKDDRTHQEVLALQELVCSDIEFFKNQQWQATYYGSLLYAAIVFVPEIVGDYFPKTGFVVLGVACFLILVSGIYVLSQLEKALVHRRELLPKLRQHFTDKALQAYGNGDRARALKPANEKTSLRWVFVAAYTFGFVLAIWILTLKWCAHA